MAKPAPGSLFGVLYAAGQAGLADLWQEATGEVAAEYGDSHILTHVVRGMAQHYGRSAEQSGREHGYSYQPQPAPPQARAASPTALFNAAVAARAEGDHATALDCFTMAAEQGHARAMVVVAAFYQEGEQVDRNLRKAAAWWGRALQAGETDRAPDALNRIGQMYQKGNVCARDLQAAFRLYVIAAAAGNMHAQYNAGWYLWRGFGGQAQDLAEARRLFRLSAAQGFADAARDLAAMDAENTARLGGGGREQRPEPPPGSGMPRKQALEVIGMQEGASNADMKAAWLRLHQVIHPDKGGSDYFAKQLNAARETLGF